MKVLVAFASRHGATQEIAERIGERLAASGIDVAVVPVGDVEAVDGFDAVVIGSAVYVGRWLEPARTFVESHAEALRAQRTWLFSSGPLGEPPKPSPERCVDIDDLMEVTRARGHRLFAGRLDRSLLGVSERAVVRLVKAAEGDFRPFSEIDAWADELTATLVGGGLSASAAS